MLLPLLGLLAVLAFSSGSCMPSDQECGTGVLLATPFFLAVTLGLLRALLALWRGSRPELRMTWLPGLTGVWVTFVMGVAAVVWFAVSTDMPDVDGVFGLALFAFGLVGGLSLGVTLIVWRIWLVFQPSSAFSWSWLPALIVLVSPAVVMTAGLISDLDEVVAMWMIGGVFGTPAAGVLLVVFLVEAAVRRSRARKRAAAAPNLGAGI